MENNDKVLVSRDEMDKRYPSQTRQMKDVINKIQSREGRDASEDFQEYQPTDEEGMIRDPSGRTRSRDPYDERYPSQNDAIEEALDFMRSQSDRRRKKRTQNISTIRLGEKISRIVTFAIKLAKINGFDDKGQIFDMRGSPVLNSDVKELILAALSPSKNLIGQEEFIKLLRKADVNPTLIVNSYIRDRMQRKTIDIESSPPSDNANNTPPPPDEGIEPQNMSLPDSDESEYEIAPPRGNIRKKSLVTRIIRNRKKSPHPFRKAQDMRNLKKWYRNGNK